jgi:DUF4097 and DUF4098 domain-containing protein YvlB
MNRDLTRRGALAALGAAGLAASAGCVGVASQFVARKEKTETDTIAVGDADRLAVENSLGDLTVRTESRSDVRYRAEMRSSIDEKNFDEMHVRDRRSNGRLTVEAVHEEDGTVTDLDPELDLTVRVPESLAVVSARVETGDVDVRGTTGDLTVEGETTDLTVRDVEGDVTARASTGDVDVRGVSGFVGADLDTGDLTVRNVGGLLDVTVDTGDASVEVPALRGDTRIGLDTGDLTARLRPDLDAAVTATADTGDVDVTGLELGQESETRVEGTLGDGTHDLTVRVDTGDVELEPL